MNSKKNIWASLVLLLTAAYCVIVPFLYWLVKKEKPKRKPSAFSGYLFDGHWADFPKRRR